MNSLIDSLLTKDKVKSVLKNVLFMDNPKDSYEKATIKEECYYEILEKLGLN